MPSPDDAEGSGVVSLFGSILTLVSGRFGTCFTCVVILVVVVEDDDVSRDVLDSFDASAVVSLTLVFVVVAALEVGFMNFGISGFAGFNTTGVGGLGSGRSATTPPTLSISPMVSIYPFPLGSPVFDVSMSSPAASSMIGASGGAGLGPENSSTSTLDVGLGSWIHGLIFLSCFLLDFHWHRCMESSPACKGCPPGTSAAQAELHSFLGTC